jgi:hypothetical protein
VRQISEAELIAWHEEIHRRKDARLIANRYFQGYVTGVAGGGPFQVSVQRIGETASDGNTYSCAVPGYVPQPGDLVELAWRDDATAHVDHPITTTLTSPPSSAAVDDQSPVGVSSITIPQRGQLPIGYGAIRIRWQGRTTSANGVDNLQMRFNGDTGNNYNYQYLFGLGVATTQASSGTVSATVVGNLAGGTSSAGLVDSGVVDVLNYTNQSFRKQFVALNFRSDGNSYGMGIFGGEWGVTTDVIRYVTLFASAGNFATGSRFTTEVH